MKLNVEGAKKKERRTPGKSTERNFDLISPFCSCFFTFYSSTASSSSSHIFSTDFFLNWRGREGKKRENHRRRENTERKEITGVRERERERERDGEKEADGRIERATKQHRNSILYAGILLHPATAGKRDHEREKFALTVIPSAFWFSQITHLSVRPGIRYDTRRNR